MPATGQAVVVVPDSHLVGFPHIYRVEPEAVGVSLLKAVPFVGQRDVVRLALVSIQRHVDIGVCPGTLDVTGEHPGLPVDF